MKNKLLFFILLIISVICAGQNNLQIITMPAGSSKTINRFDKEFQKADSAWRNKTIAISGFSPNEMLTLSRQKITICLDYFKVTDTIWIMAGKRKVGVPAYEFLKYFKDEPLNGTIFMQKWGDKITPANKNEHNPIDL